MTPPNKRRRDEEFRSSAQKREKYTAIAWYGQKCLLHRDLNTFRFDLIYLETAINVGNERSSVVAVGPVTIVNRLRWTVHTLKITTAVNFQRRKRELIISTE